MHNSEVSEAAPVVLADILRLRDLYRQEMNCQIVHDSHHQRGFTSPYALSHKGRIAGYGCVGDYDAQGRDVVTEFYVTPEYRGNAVSLFGALLEASGAKQIQAQTNDRLLLLMLYDFCRHDSIRGDTLLFEDGEITHLPPPPGGIFRRVEETEHAALYAHHSEPPGDWAVVVDGEIVGTGGFLCHYNPPYGDVYMEVSEGHRRKGIGGFLVQEIKRVCYEEGRRPSARCSSHNSASRRTLERAGFHLCARILRGEIPAGG